MSDKTYHYIAAAIFFAVAIGHLARIVYSWEAMIGGVPVPLWISWAGVIIAGYLSMRGWHIAQSRR